METHNYPPHSTRIDEPLNAVSSLTYNLSYSLENYNKTSVKLGKRYKKRAPEDARFVLK